MIKMFFEALFNLITSLANTIIQPVFSAITALFPDLSMLFRAIDKYLEYGVEFTGWIVNDLLCIPRSALQFAFTYISIRLSIFAVVNAVKLVLTIYNKLKV